MPSQRIQRQIDALLDAAEASLALGEWNLLAEKARAVLAMDPANEDASALLHAAQANLNATTTLAAAPEVSAAAAPSEPSSFAAGRYQVRRFLGEGGRKRVFLAHDALLDRDIALALIKTDGLDEVGRERILREAQAMGRMGAHPHLVSVFDLGDEAGAPYVVTELMQGGDVEGELERAGGALELTRVLEIATAVARGLAFAHERGIVHRDLKPGNVWLTADGTAKIGDFGLAVAEGRSRLTQHGVMVGTFAYMPPEQALGGEAKPRSDLYSLGAMLYELVTGRPPFQGDTPTAVISQHLNATPVAPSWHTQHCPPALEDLILALLAKDPASRPTSAAEVLAVLERIDPTEPSRSHSSDSANPLERLARGVFVGRDRELERLRGALDTAFTGHGSVVMLVGEPGIGKTWTVQELETYARMRGAKVLWGRAHESSGAPPYWPWVQIARAYREETPDADVRRRQYAPYAVELQRIFPGLRELFPNLAAPSTETEEGQFRLFDAFSAFARDVAQETPLVFVLDDLHWADRATLGLLAYLARELGRARILVVGTYRDTDLDRRHPLAQTLAELNREDLFTRIPLRGLSLEETADYVRKVANLKPPRELVARIFEETEGNPFFLAEVVNLMTQEDTLRASVSDVRIPEGVREALGRRLDRLSEEANALLTTLAVAGRDFEHALVRELSGQDDATTLALVEEALRARVLEETGAGRYRFTHALMQETLLGELSAARRVLLHGQIAEVLEQLYSGDAEAHAAALAVHYIESSALNREHARAAGVYSRQAGRRAESALAWDEAKQWYEAALRFLDSMDVATEADLRLGLGRALLGVSEAVDGLAELERAQDLFTSLADEDGVTRATLAIEAAGAGLSDHERLRRTGKALAVTTEPGANRARLLLLRAAWSPGPTLLMRAPERDAEAEEARAIAVRLHLTDVLARLRLRSAGVMRATDLAGAMRTLEDAEKELAALGDQVGVDRAIWSRQLFARSLDHWLEVTRQQVEYGFSTGQKRNAHGTACLRAFALIEARGDINAALEAIAGSTGFYVTHMVHALVAEFAGHITTAQDSLQQAHGPTTPELAVPIIEGLRGRFLWRIGKRDDAGAIAEATVRTLRTTRGWPLLWSYGIFVDYFAATLPADAFVEWFAGEDVLRTLQGWPDGLFNIWTMPARRTAVAALVAGDLDRAEERFQFALAACGPDRDNCPVELGRCLQGLAEVAERRGQHLEAMAHLDAAGELFARHGAKLYLDHVIAKKQILKA